MRLFWSTIPNRSVGAAPPSFLYFQFVPHRFDVLEQPNGSTIVMPESGSTHRLVHRIEGNVIYLNLKDREARTSDGFLEGLDATRRTALMRLSASISLQWTPARIQSKIRSIGFDGDEARHAFEYVTGGSFDPGPAADREIQRRLARCFGERRISAELAARGFDRSLIEERLGAVPAEQWMEALGRHLGEDGLPEDPAKRKKTIESLQRRGFSVNQIVEYARSRRPS